MKRANVLGAALAVAGLIATAAPASAQTVGADLSLFSSYVWRGLSLTNKPVAQPDLYVTFPAGSAASITLGGWANVDLGKYDDPNDDISESGGLSSFNFAEFDPWAEISYPVGKATLTGGITGYFYPNDAGLTSDFNTWEVYGKAAFDVPLSPKIAAWYDIDKVKGLYVEGSVAHSVPLGESHSLSLGALAGFNAGQHADFDSNGDPQAEFYNFADNGFTHLDLSAGLPLSAGAFSITPVVHFQVNGDDFTKVNSPSNFDEDIKLWGGVTISWSKSYGAAAEEETTE